MYLPFPGSCEVAAARKREMMVGQASHAIGYRLCRLSLQIILLLRGAARLKGQVGAFEFRAGFEFSKRTAELNLSFVDNVHP